MQKSMVLSCHEWWSSRGELKGLGPTTPEALEYKKPPRHQSSEHVRSFAEKDVLFGNGIDEALTCGFGELLPLLELELPERLDDMFESGQI